MDKLYPIIRRKRRPLVVAETPPAAAVPVQPMAAKPLVESVPVALATEKTKLSDGENISQPEAE
jgi:hypothetical protein